MSPEVTAVITTHVRPILVREALESVHAETHSTIEVVIVDDGGAFVAPEQGAGAGIRVVRGAGAGVGVARNLGLAAARGEYIIFLDDDDLAMPQRIARLVSVARDQNATLCFGMTRRLVEDTSQVLESVPTHLLAPGPVGFCDLLTCAPHVNAVLARTEALRAVGGFDTGAEHFDDWSAWLRMADGDAVMWCISDTVADWRIHEQGLTARVLQGGGMKVRLMSLFERLDLCLSRENARGVGAALRIVQSADIVTYDDYADTMARAREVLHAAGACFGRPLFSHLVPVSDEVVVA
jgi:glycosyltransferase involved in cell wall biosynthesis